MATKRPATDDGGSEAPPAKKSSLTSIKPLNLGAIYSLDKACDSIPDSRSSSSSQYETDEEREVERKKQAAVKEKDKGNDYFKRGDYDNAIECYTKGAELDPTNPLLPANRAMALLKQNKFAAAEIDCTVSLTLDPIYTKAYLRRGTARLGLTKFAAAKEDYERVLHLEPQNKKAKTDLETIEKHKACDSIPDSRSSSSSQYETDEEREVERKKQAAVKEKDKGNDYFKRGDYDNAIECYTKGAELDPTNPLLPANRAMALLKQNKFAAAEIDCTVSLTLDPLYTKAYLRRGTARLGLTQFSAAKEDYERVLHLEPQNKKAKTDLETIEKMSEIEDDHRTLSRHLWGILDGIGLCPEERKAATNRAITREILLTLEHVLAGNKVTVYNAGSNYEATTTAGLQSDMDIIYVPEYRAVVEYLQHAPQNDDCLWLVPDSSTPAGYTKLQFVVNGCPCIVHPTESFDHPDISVDRHGRVLRNNGWGGVIWDNSLDNEMNGPASTAIYSYGPTVDRVCAYRCASWPDAAREWLTRDRCHNWPTEDQLQELRALGCLVVGVGHCHSTESEQTLEWRVSFTLQERYLMISLNETQYKCYVVMKVFKKDFITSQLQDSISSYHLKTVLLYAIESNPAEFWVPDNLVNCVLFCLEALYKCALKGDCPSYFIPEANLFDRRVHGELRKQVVSLLAELLQVNGKFLFRINCDNIGIQLSAASTSRAPHIASVVLDTAMLMKHCIRAGHDITSLVTTILYYTRYTSIETLQDQISRLDSTTRVVEHTDSETREAIQYVLPHIHTRLVSHLAAEIVLRGEGNNTAGNMRTLMGEHVQLVNSSGNTSCRLKVATLYYMLEDYIAAERLLSDAAAALREPVVYACPCLFRSTGRFVYPCKHLPKYFVNLNLCLVENCKDFVNSYLCPCISFLPSEMAVTPAALQYEMFKSRRTPAEHWGQEKQGWWYEWSNVNPEVFLHYMQYLVYDKLGDVWRRQRARNYLVRVAVTYDSLCHRETAFNLLGWIFKQEGDIITAAKCFLLSISMEPGDNAAKWHIADLYLRQSKASRRVPFALTLPMISY